MHYTIYIHGHQQHLLETAYLGDILYKAMETPMHLKCAVLLLTLLILNWLCNSRIKKENLHASIGNMIILLLNIDFIENDLQCFVDAIHQVMKSRICLFGGFFPHFISRLSFAAHYCDIFTARIECNKKHKNVQR
jgi:hypothetical protein